MVSGVVDLFLTRGFMLLLPFTIVQILWTAPKKRPHQLSTNLPVAILSHFTTHTNNNNMKLTCQCILVTLVALVVATAADDIKKCVLFAIVNATTSKITIQAEWTGSF